MAIMLIDKFIQFIKNSMDIEKKESSAFSEGEHEASSIYKALDRVMASDEISGEMKDYASKLVDTYLPAIYCTYMASKGSSDNITARINKDIDGVKSNILSSIESCLIDIEHGACFDDNLSNPFVNCLLAFEQVIDDRVPKN